MILLDIGIIIFNICLIIWAIYKTNEILIENGRKNIQTTN